MSSGLCPGTTPTGQLAISPVGGLIDCDSVNVFNPILNSHHVVTSSTVCVAWKTSLLFHTCSLLTWTQATFCTLSCTGAREHTSSCKRGAVFDQTSPFPSWVWHNTRRFQLMGLPSHCQVLG